MLYSFWAEEYLIESQHRFGSKLAGMFVMLPSIIYAALVWIMNFYYRKFANFLTEWGKQRLFNCALRARLIILTA